MKKILATLILGLGLLILNCFAATTTNYQLSSHILDINTGAPAANVKITLQKLTPKGDKWILIDEKITDKNGRIKEFLPQTPNTNHHGIYKLTYHVKPYFDALKQKTFYPFIEVVFEIKDNSHYHVPITLSPYGYSTYRGN